MNILFVNLSGLVFNVATPASAPLGGSESAMCYLAVELARRGHGVTLVVKTPEGEPEYIAGVRHVPLTVLQNSDFVAAGDFDAIVVANAPVAGPSLRAMAPKALILFWDHLAPDHLYVGHLRHAEARDSFDGFIYVSDWQRKVTENLFAFAKPGAIIGNGFAPAFAHMFDSAAALRAAKTNRAAYTTTPFRGLVVLVDAMAGLDTGTELDIYSSMNVYQSAKEDRQYDKLYAYAASRPNIRNHGAVAQTELARRLRTTAFFAYPSTYAETFCIAALEARAAGMKVLTTATAALPEILGDRADYVRASVEEPQRLIADFRAMLRGNAERFLKQPDAWAEERFADLQEVNRSCSWARRAEEWEGVMAGGTWT